MLDSLLYRMRRSLLKKPANLVLFVLGVALMGVMIYYPTLLADELPAYNPETAIGVMSILSFFMLDIVASGMLNGTISGYTLSDVNFHFAGPYTPKFNKLIGLINTSKTGLLMAFVLCCQAAVLSQVATFRSLDMICLLFVVFFVTVTGGCIANIVSPYSCMDDESDRNKNIITAVFIAVNVIVLLIAFISLIRAAGSISNIGNLGTAKILAVAGNSLGIKYFPFSGFITTIYAGIVTGNVVTLIVGIVLTIISIAVLAILFNKLNPDYYEAAIASALKINDFVEAKKAGIDTDTARLNNKVKVGKEELNKGWGVNTFMFTKMFEFKRQTKFFFVNPLAMLYRVITLIYLFIIFGRGGSSASDMTGDPFMMSLIMNIALNVIIYSGGKTVLEFNRPYFFLAPYSAARKLFYSIMGEFPCMVFDSFLCIVTTGIFTGFDAYPVTMWVLLFAIMIVFDIMCTMISILGIRMFRSLGRYALMMTRYLSIYLIIILEMVASLGIMYALDAEIEVGMLVFLGISLVVTLCVFAMSPIIVNNVES